MDHLQINGIGIAVFFGCMLVFHILAAELIALPFILCLILSLIAAVLTVLFLSLYSRIAMLETQISWLSDRLYRLEKDANRL